MTPVIWNNNIILLANVTSCTVAAIQTRLEKIRDYVHSLSFMSIRGMKKLKFVRTIRLMHDLGGVNSTLVVNHKILQQRIGSLSDLQGLHIFAARPCPSVSILVHQLYLNITFQKSFSGTENGATAL